jgi:hypothetical protein
VPNLAVTDSEQLPGLLDRHPERFDADLDGHREVAIDRQQPACLVKVESVEVPLLPLRLDPSA